MEPVTHYEIRASVFVPALLTLGVLACSIFVHHYWLLTAIPFIALGSVCAAPNLNLADGLPVIVALIVAFVANRFDWFAARNIGEIISAGVMSGWLLGAVEKQIRARAVKKQAGSRQS